MVIEQMHHEDANQKAVIKVCGVGGAGGNAVNRMIDSGMTEVEFIAINTDPMDLRRSKAPVRIQIGDKMLGAGAKPEIGRQACEEGRDRIRVALQGADMIFLTVGLGGGTGTGAAPIVAEEAKASGSLLVAIVTLPFSYEGKDRMDKALVGLEELEQHVDSLIVVPNDRIAELSDTETTFLEAFHKGDEVLHNGVRAISELITVPGMMNVDFADVKTVMEARGRALMGIGVAEGPDRAIRAAQDAINCPLLEQSGIRGAKGVIINVRGGKDMLIHEMVQANEYIKSNIEGEDKIICGAVLDDEPRPDIQITVIAAGFPKKDPSTYIKHATTVMGIPVVTSTPPKPVREEAPAAMQAPAAQEMKPAPHPAMAPPTLPRREEKRPPIIAGQRELPLPAAGVKAPAPKEKVDLKIPAFMRRALEKKQNNDDSTISKTTSARSTT